MLSVKQGDIKYHFLSLWYDSNWDWTPGSRAIGEYPINYYKKVKLVNVVQATQRLPFQLLQHRGVEEGATPFPGLLYFTIDPYLIMLSDNQGVIKYHFLSLFCGSNWDWTPATGEHYTHYANKPTKKRFFLE